MQNVRAVCLPAPQAAVVVSQMDVPDPGPGEALVRMQACGVCHSDVMITGLPKLPLEPLVLGHEGIGIVEALGEGTGDLAIGDRVGVTYLASGCGKCENCRSGRQRFCLKQNNHGYTRHGAMTTAGVVAAQNLIKVAETLSAQEAAPLCCAGWTAYGALREAGVGRGQLVAIFGMGGLGHLAVHYAKHLGARVVAVDVSPEKLEFASRLGVEAAVSIDDARKVIGKEMGGADAAIVFTAAAAAVPVAFSTLKRCGNLILVGMTTDKFSISVTEAVLKGVRIQGSYLGTREDLEAVFALAARGIAKPEVHAHELDEAPELITRLKGGGIVGRAVIVF